MNKLLVNFCVDELEQTKALCDVIQCSGTFQIVTAINFQQVLWQCKRLSLINICFILVFL